MAAGPEPLVVWINGAFGVGKTSVAEELLALLPGAMLFDPESVGSLLRAVVPVVDRTDDFQDISAWRAMTRAAALALASERRGAVVIPMTVVEHAYFEEIVGEIRRAGVRVVHVSLVAPAAVVAARLRLRGDERWALARVDRCVEALADPRFAVHLDAERESPANLARAVAGLAGVRV